VYVAELPAQGELLELPAIALQHLAQVLRLRVGDRVCVFDGAVEFQAQIEVLERRRGQARLLEKLGEAVVPPVRLTLVCGTIRHQRMDWLYQKATELGVVAIQPVSSARSRRSARGRNGTNNSRQRHCQQVIISACEQCGRIDVPRLRSVVALQAYLQSARGKPLWVYGDPGAEGPLSLPAQAGAVGVLVGPEGGWSDEEVTVLRHHGAVGMRLGPRILRSETAGLVLLTLMQQRYGDLRFQ